MIGPRREHGFDVEIAELADLRARNDVGDYLAARDTADRWCGALVRPQSLLHLPGSH